jgi:hypothetical protein
MLPNIRPITNIRHKAVNIAKVSNCGFLGWHLQVAVDTMLDGHDLWATETNMHTKLTMSTKSLLSRENIAWK